MKHFFFLVVLTSGGTIFGWDWITENAEVGRNWGWNATTLSFFATLFFAIFAAWSLYHQNKLICDRKRALSVSKIWFTWATAMFLGAIVYGYFSGSLALILTGTILLYWHAIVLVNLLRYEKFSNAQLSLGVIAFTGLLIMLLWPESSVVVFTILMFGSVCVRFDLPYQVWKEKSSGELEIKYIAVGLVNILFWIIYAFSTGNVPLMIVNPILFIIFSVTIVLWLRYKNVAN